MQNKSYLMYEINFVLKKQHIYDIKKKMNFAFKFAPSHNHFSIFYYYEISFKMHYKFQFHFNLVVIFEIFLHLILKTNLFNLNLYIVYDIVPPILALYATPIPQY